MNAFKMRYNSAGNETSRLSFDRIRTANPQIMSNARPHDAEIKSGL